MLHLFSFGLHDRVLNEHVIKKARCKAGLLVLYCGAVVIIHGSRPVRVAPVPGIVVAVFRRSLELRLGDVGALSAKVGIVFQRLPGQGIMVVADSEKAAKAQDGV
jgi:hypothetical protein